MTMLKPSRLSTTPGRRMACAAMILSTIMLSACGEEANKEPLASLDNEAAAAVQADAAPMKAKLEVAAVEAATELADISNFYVQDNVYAGGLPSEAQMKAFAAAGVKTVIDFRSEAEGLEEQQQTVAALGLEYVNIPLGRELASVEAQQKFAQVFAAAGSDKVLLHCRSGNRVGMIWSLHQIANKMDLEQAIQEGRAMGMKPGFEQAVRVSLQ